MINEIFDRAERRDQDMCELLTHVELAVAAAAICNNWLRACFRGIKLMQDGHNIDRSTADRLLGEDFDLHARALAAAWRAIAPDVPRERIIGTAVGGVIDSLEVSHETGRMLEKMLMPYMRNIVSEFSQ
jgi:hypothetical protein